MRRMDWLFEMYALVAQPVRQVGVKSRRVMCMQRNEVDANMLNTGNKIQDFNKDAVFKSLDLSEQSLDGRTFNDCVFENCTFINGSWRMAQFHDCSFRCCNLNFVKLEGALLQDVLFQECKLVGIEFYKCSKTFLSIRIQQGVLLNCNFSEMDLRKTSFKQSQLRECFFKNTNLSGADFGETDLEGSLFHQCTLDKADFRTAKNYTINLQLNSAKKARFSYPEVMRLLTFFDIAIEEV